MSDTTIRQIHGDEMLEIVYWLDSYAFNASPPMPDKTKRLEMFRQRVGPTHFALFEDDVPVACAAGTPMIQQVRGAMFGIGGIFDVLTHPAARRKGYSRRMLARTLSAIRDDGRPLSCLYPFRESFYERLGYVTFPLPRKAKLTPLALQPLLKKDLGGGGRAGTDRRRLRHLPGLPAKAAKARSRYGHIRTRAKGQCAAQQFLAGAGEGRRRTGGDDAI